MQTIEKRLENADKDKNKSKKEGGANNSLIDRPALYAKIRSALNAGIPLIDVVWDGEAEQAEVENMQFLTSKPIAIVCNVDEKSTNKHNKYTTAVFAHIDALNKEPETVIPGTNLKVKRFPRSALRVCSQLESEVQTLDSAESRAEFLAMNELESGSLPAVIQMSNKLLQNICYYTVGEKEARAWGINKGTNAQVAAGKIHSDLSKGFVCAEVIKPAEFIKYNGDQGARTAGAMKVEGKNYIVQDGDIMLFRVQGQKGR